MRSIHSALLACALPLALAACQAPPADSPNHLGEAYVAQIDGKAVPESVFRLYALNRTQRSPDQLSAEEREAILEEVLQIYLLAGAAEKQAVDQERTMAAQLELQRLNALARAAVARYREENAASELELREAYEANLEELSAPQYKARHILVEAEEEAAALIEQLNEGADFAELAKEHSTGPTGPNGGDLGWFDANTMVPPFADAVRAMSPGSFSEAPVQTRFGWHVILLEDSKDNEAPGLDAVRERMQNTVEQQKVEAYIASLRDKATIDLTAGPANSESE